MTKEQFVAIAERLGTWSIMYAVGRGWLPLNLQGETLMFLSGGASLLYGWLKNSRYGKIIAADKMSEVAAIVMNSKGSDIAKSVKTSQKVVNGVAGERMMAAGSKIMEVVEVTMKAVDAEGHARGVEEERKRG